jgi:hypothetical protein
MDDTRKKLNQVYGRGFHDGLKVAGKQLVKEKVMNEAKFQSVFRNVSEQAKKVYNAVPISESWSSSQIMAELARTNRSTEHRVVLGCLASLREVGLIKESATGLWIRTEVRTKQLHSILPYKIKDIDAEELQPTEDDIKSTKEITVKPKKEIAVPPINTQPTPQKTDPNITPLERIGGLSQQVLTIIQSLHQLAADIEATALEVEEQMDKINKDSAMLKQFQQLLKGLQQ